MSVKNAEITWLKGPWTLKKFRGYEIIEIWPKYSTSASIESIQRAHAQWDTSTITRFILSETTIGHARWQTSTLTRFIQVATTMGNAQWKTSTMTWFILLKTTMGHTQLHTRMMTRLSWPHGNQFVRHDGLCSPKKIMQIRLRVDWMVITFFALADIQKHPAWESRDV